MYESAFDGLCRFCKQKSSVVATRTQDSSVKIICNNASAVLHFCVGREPWVEMLSDSHATLAKFWRNAGGTDYQHDDIQFLMEDGTRGQLAQWLLLAGYRGEMTDLLETSLKRARTGRSKARKKSRSKPHTKDEDEEHEDSDVQARLYSWLVRHAKIKCSRRSDRFVFLQVDPYARAELMLEVVEKMAASPPFAKRGWLLTGAVHAAQLGEPRPDRRVGDRETDQDWKQVFQLLRDMSHRLYVCIDGTVGHAYKVLFDSVWIDDRALPVLPVDLNFDDAELHKGMYCLYLEGWIERVLDAPPTAEDVAAAVEQAGDVDADIQWGFYKVETASQAASESV